MILCISYDNDMMGFDESAWDVIESQLPNDEYIKREVLKDFIWNMKRPSRYSNDKDIIEDYIRHLRLRGSRAILGNQNIDELFKRLDLVGIKNRLMSHFVL